MLEYLSRNMGYIVVTAALALIVAAILVRMVRTRRAGRGGCGCGCDHCANAGFCHPEAAGPDQTPGK